MIASKVHGEDEELRLMKAITGDEALRRRLSLVCVTPGNQQHLSVSEKATFLTRGPRIQ